MQPDLRPTIKTALAAHGVTLVAVARYLDQPYDRIQRVVHGYRRPRPGEVERILEAITRLGQRTAAGA